MKSPVKSTSFFALIVACLVGFTAYDYFSGEKKEAQHAKDEKVVQLQRSDLTTVLIEGQKNSFEIAKSDPLKPDKWMITKPFEESADQQQVFTYLDQLASEKIQQTVSESPVDLAPYGLQAPLFTLTLKTAHAQETIKLGSVKAYDGSLYAQIDNQKKVILVSSAWDLILSKPAKDLRDTRVFQRPVKVDFDRVEVQSNDTHFVFERKDGAYLLKGSLDSVYQPGVQAWLEQIKALRGVAFVDKILPHLKPDYTITMTRADDKPFVLQIKRDTRPEQYIVTSTDLPGGFSSQVITGQTAMNAILLTPDAFYNQRAPFDFNIQEVVHLRFHSDKAKQDLDTSVDPKHPDLLINQIHSLEAVRFLGKPAGKPFKSHLTLLKSDGKPLFEMSWGDVIVEPATLERPEARYLPVVTNLVKQVIGVPEKLILDLARQPDPPAAPPTKGAE